MLSFKEYLRESIAPGNYVSIGVESPIEVSFLGGGVLMVDRSSVRVKINTLPLIYSNGTLVVDSKFSQLMKAGKREYAE